MNIEIQPFSNNDVETIFKFIKMNSAICEKTWGWECGRFVDWFWASNALRVEKDPDWFTKNCSVVRSKGQLRAVIISEEGGKEVCVLMANEDPSLFQQIYTWLQCNWLPIRKGLHFEFSDKEIWLADILSAEGFEVKKQTGHEWQFNLKMLSEFSGPPEGWTVTSLAENNESVIPGIAEAILKAFNWNLSVEQCVKVLANLKLNPLYRPEFSVFAHDHRGVIAAYCRGTVSLETGIAAIDPVCCHPEYQRKGLATAVVQQCFQEQAKAGGNVCYIGSAPIPAASTFFYKSLKPEQYYTMDCWHASS